MSQGGARSPGMEEGSGAEQVVLARVRARQQRGQERGRKGAVLRGCSPAWPRAAASSLSARRERTPTLGKPETSS